jgi:SPP1 gp7 family putative phage head morphogenesis protein
MKKKPKVALYPDRIEREYERLLRGYVLGMSKETLAKLKDMELLRLDSWSEDVTALFLLLSAQFLAVGESLTLRLPGIYAQVNQFQDQQWRLVVKSGTGITIPAGQSVPYGMTPYGSVSDPNLIRARFGMGIDVYRSEPWLAARQANWVAQNTALIKSIAPQYMTSVETIVRQGVMSGTAPKVLAKQIQQASGVTMKRATLIARDQINKANGELTQHRQMDLGIDSYQWDTSNDERVRPSHVAREGKIYSWSKPPEGGGHPGQEILCRCRALPQFDDEDD